MPRLETGADGQYEDNLDRWHEEQARQFISSCWQCRGFKRESSEQVDFTFHAVHSDDYVAVMEQKRRYNLRQKFPTVFIDVPKYAAGQYVSQTHNCPFYLIGWWDDGLRVCLFTPGEKFPEKTAPFFQRAHSEKVHEIPVDRFCQVIAVDGLVYPILGMMKNRREFWSI